MVKEFKSKKLMLVGLNARYTHSNLALLYLRQILEATDGYEYGLVEMTINSRRYEIIKKIYAFCPDIVCFSVYIWNAELVRKICSELKILKPDLHIVLGGPEVAYSPELWLQPGLTVICGYERAFQTFLEDPERYRGKSVADFFSDIASLSFPYDHTIMSKLKGRYVYYESSRGCPRGCTYCLSSALKEPVQYRRLDNVFKELLFFIDHKVDTLKFIDRTFNAKPERARQIWEYLLEHNRSTVFHFEIQAEFLGEEDFKLLRKIPPGMFRFEVGIQSCNSRTLEEIGRNANVTPVLEKSKRLVIETDVHLHVDLIAGLPGEDFASFRESFNRVFSVGADHLQLGFLKLLHGTTMRKRQHDYAMLASPFPPYQIFQSGDLAFEEMIAVENIEHLLESLHNSGRFPIFMRFLLENENPFDLFRSFVEFAVKKDFDITVTAPEKILNFLAAYIAEVCAGDLLLQDALVLDTLSAGRSLSFPKLFAFYERERQEAVVDMFNYYHEQGIPCNQKELHKRILVFYPQSQNFLKKAGLAVKKGVIFYNSRAERGDPTISNLWYVIYR